MMGEGGCVSIKRGDVGTIEMNFAIKYTLLSEDVVGLE